MKPTCFFSFFLSLLIYLPTSAQQQPLQLTTQTASVIPQKMTYQGVLTNNSGVALTGTYTMTFGLYTLPTGGSPSWAETQNTVQVTGGIFSVLLGTNTPINLTFDSTFYLAVNVQGNDLLPRIELASSAYSFNTARIQGRLVSSNSPSSGQVLKWSGSDWTPATDQTGTGGFIGTNQAYLGETAWFQTTDVDVASVSVTVAAGQKVLIMCSCEVATSPGGGAIALYISGANQANDRTVYCAANGIDYPASLLCVETSASGIVTYTLRAKCAGTGYDGKVRRVNLVAIVG